MSAWGIDSWCQRGPSIGEVAIVSRGIQHDSPVGDSGLLRGDRRRKSVDGDRRNFAIVMSDSPVRSKNSAEVQSLIIMGLESGARHLASAC